MVRMNVPASAGKGSIETTLIEALPDLLDRQRVLHAISMGMFCVFFLAAFIMEYNQIGSHTVNQTKRHQYSALNLSWAVLGE